MQNRGALEAWLEGANDRRWTVASHCTIGRSPGNTFVLDDKLVSRRHALIHCQDFDQFWLVDLGSGNGSFVNGRRVTLPTHIIENDVLEFGETKLKFRQPVTLSTPAVADASTLIEVKKVGCWLMLTDIVGSTKLAAKLTSNEWAVMVGNWAGECQRIIELHGGTISKYLGDGALAVWVVANHPTEHIVGAIRKLQELQSADPPFRIVVHIGEVFAGGDKVLGEDPLSGLDLIMTFRMERLASAQKKSVFISEPAFKELAPHLKLVCTGVHRLPDFPDETPRNFYTVG